MEDNYSFASEPGEYEVPTSVKERSQSARQKVDSFISAKYKNLKEDQDYRKELADSEYNSVREFAHEYAEGLVCKYLNNFELREFKEDRHYISNNSENVARHMA